MLTSVESGVQTMCLEWLTVDQNCLRCMSLDAIPCSKSPALAWSGEETQMTQISLCSKQETWEVRNWPEETEKRYQGGVLPARLSHMLQGHQLSKLSVKLCIGQISPGMLQLPNGQPTEPESCCIDAEARYEEEITPHTSVKSGTNSMSLVKAVEIKRRKIGLWYFV